MKSATLSLLFFLALDGSINHEVGEVNVALSFVCLQHKGTNRSVRRKQRRHFLTTAAEQLTSSVFSRHDGDMGQMLLPSSCQEIKPVTYVSVLAYVNIQRISGNMVAIFGTSGGHRLAETDTAVAEMVMSHLQPPEAHAASVTH